MWSRSEDILVLPLIIKTHTRFKNMQQTKQNNEINRRKN